MRSCILILLITLTSALSWAQTAALSSPISVRIEKNITPAILEIEPGSIRFEDESGNNAIDANERCSIKMTISNIGKGEAVGCKAKFRILGQTKDISISDITVPNIKPGGKQVVTIPIVSGKEVQNGQIIVSIEITEPHGFGTDPTELTLTTRELSKPYLKIVDYAVISSQGSTILRKKTPFDLQLLLQNVKRGEAQNVKVDLQLPQGVYLMDGQEQVAIDKLAGGETRSLEYSLIVTNNYTSENIPISVAISEKNGSCSENKSFDLKINQALSSNKTEIQALATTEDEIQVAQIGSVVDKNIPQNQTINSNTFVLIIANESYLKVASVPYALNDGIIFQKYCTATLGIPDLNIHYLPNATLGQILIEIDWLKKVADAFQNPKIILYYAGHGIPDERNQTAYLLPIDGIGNDWNTGYKLDDLYATLGSLPVKSITIFLDACFSGAARSGKMLASARGVAIKARPGMPQGNMVVFAAAQGDETAYQNKQEGHGMFTFFLLKKLQETKGDVTLQDLSDYIVTNVKQQSILLNGKSQTPCITPSLSVDYEWGKWKLK